MQNERIGMLKKFEEKEKRKEYERLYKINKEREDMVKRKQNEREKMLQKKEEERQLSRVVHMFNSKEIPSFIIGQEIVNASGAENDRSNIYYPGWSCQSSQQYKFTIHTFNKIKDCNVFELYKIYKKIVDDYCWIKKYVYSPQDIPKKAYIDFCFDNYIDKIDELLKNSKKDLETCRNNLKINNACLNSSFQNKFNTITSYYNYLLELKTLNHSREFYYINDENKLYNELDKGGPPNWVCMLYQTPASMKKDWFLKQLEIMNTFLDDFINKFDKNSENNCFYHLPSNQNPNWGQDDYTRNNLRQVNILNSYKSYIKHCITKNGATRYGCEPNGVYYRNFTLGDLNPLINLCKIIIELIEFLRPDVILVDENESIQYEKKECEFWEDLIQGDENKQIKYENDVQCENM
jgi:hypothetical protein